VDNYKRWFRRLEDEQDTEKVRALLKELVEGRPYDECLYVDCKEARGWDKEKKDFKGVLAKAVSAFANADGGVILWGYEVKHAHDDKNKVLRIPKAIQNVGKLVELLNRLGPECTHPPVDDIRTIGVLGDDGSGFAVTYVAPSDGGPHRAAMGPKDVKDKYFLRRCDRSEVVAHYELEGCSGADRCRTCTHKRASWGTCRREEESHGL